MYNFKLSMRHLRKNIKNHFAWECIFIYMTMKVTKWKKDRKRAETSEVIFNNMFYLSQYFNYYHLDI